MNKISSTKKISYSALLLISLALLVTASSAAVLSIENGQVTAIGSTAAVNMILDSAPNGLVGYTINITIGDPSVAVLSGVSFPTWATYSDNTTLPGSSVQLKAADLTEKVQAGATNINLATIGITGLKGGTTPVTLTITSLEADSETQIPSTIQSGTFTVDVPVAPVAAFSATPTNLNVQFTDQSTNTPTSWSWDFGDGTAVSTAQSPSHTYAAAGTYSVTLTATNAAGPNAHTEAVTVSAAPVTPVAAFSANATSGNAPLAVQFTDQSSETPTEWQWDFGDGSANGTVANPSHTYASAGTFPVTLTVSNSGGSNSLIKTGYIVVSAAPPSPPVANFNKNVSSGPAPLAVLFTDTSTGGAATSWAWDFQNDGTIDSIVKDPVFVYTTAGTYAVNLTVSNAGGSNSRLKTGFITVTSAGSPPVIDFGADNRSGLAPLTVHFSDLSSGSPTSWSWDLNNDGVIESTEQNPVYTYANPGIYQVNLTATNAFGSTSRLKGNFIIVSSAGDQNPAVDFSASPQTGDAPLTVHFADLTQTTPTSWAWDFQNDHVIDSTEQNPTFTFTTPGTYQVNLTATNATGTASRLKVNGVVVTTPSVTAPIAAFSADHTSGAAPLMVQFTDQSTNSPTSWAWNFGDGSANSTEQNPSHTYGAGGTYSVTLTSTNAGGSGSTIRSNLITVNSNPTIYFVPDHQNVPLATTTDYTIILDGAPQGLTGYDFVVDLTTPDVAQITKVTYPAWAEMTQSPTVPANSVRLSGVDTGYQVQAGAKDIALGTITLKGIGIGSTPIRIGSMNLDGDDGNTFTVDQPAGNGVISVVAQNSPVAVFSANTTSGRAPLDVQFTDASTGTVTTWAWEFGDGTTSTGQSPEHVYADVGPYTVKLTVSGPGGSNSVVKTSYITVNADGPVAAFTMNPTSGITPLTVQFTDASTGPVTSWAWNFGNDTLTDSATQNPTYIYTTPGTYTVTLTATGPGGSSTTTLPITVSASTPVARFVGAPTSGIAPLTVQFNDASLGSITTYNWVFGDGSTSTTQNPSHTYNSAGVYNVTLTVTGPGGSDTMVKTNYITLGGLTADFSANVTHGVASRNVSFPVAFTDLSVGNPVNPTSWNWNFGNSATSTGQNPVAEYSGRPRNFTVTLSAGNGIDNAAKTRVDYIQITPYLEAFPGQTNLPTNPNGYYGPYVYEDVNGNGRLDYGDIVTYYQNKQWISDNYPVDIENYDYNFNGAIDYNDVIRIYWDVLNSRS